VASIYADSRKWMLPRYQPPRSQLVDSPPPSHHVYRVSLLKVVPSRGQSMRTGVRLKSATSDSTVTVTYKAARSRGLLFIFCSPCVTLAWP
jgi:hypothetical protein